MDPPISSLIASAERGDRAAADALFAALYSDLQVGAVALGAAAAAGARYGNPAAQQAAETGLRQLTTSMAARTVAENEAGGRITAWYAEIASQTLSFGENSVFEEVDKLLAAASSGEQSS